MKQRMTVAEWNEKRELELKIREADSIRDLEILGQYPCLTPYLCNSCCVQVEAQAHVDANSKYLKRQVICTNPSCKRIDYILL